MWITWHQAVWLSVGCFGYALATARLARTDPTRGVAHVLLILRSILREVGIVAGLYALWQWVFTLTVTKTAGAMDHARDIYAAEQALGLPSEVTIQHWTMESRWLIEFLNRYYAYVHVSAMGILIVWLFFRHREQYPLTRNVLALSTGACLAIQSIPVAPPRFLPDFGFVDTALLYGQSVYGAGGSGLSNQLAAMPSVHVTWSVLIAVTVVCVLESRWRWLIVAHPIVTLWAVVATGNHWWADGIVAVGLLAVSYGLAFSWQAFRSRSPSSPSG